MCIVYSFVYWKLNQWDSTKIINWLLDSEFPKIMTTKYPFCEILVKCKVCSRDTVRVVSISGYLIVRYLFCPNTCTLLWCEFSKQIALKFSTLYYLPNYLPNIKKLSLMSRLPDTSVLVDQDTIYEKVTAYVVYIVQHNILLFSVSWGGSYFRFESTGKFSKPTNWIFLQ